MIIPVRCFTCGKTLADKYDWYIKETAKLRSEVDGKKTPQTGALAHFDPVPTAALLDMLGLTRSCCRRHMVGEVDMTEKI